MKVYKAAQAAILVDLYPTRRFRRWAVVVFDTLHSDAVDRRVVAWCWTFHGAALRAEREASQIMGDIELLRTAA